jgi:hypothetical protein
MYVKDNVAKMVWSDKINYEIQSEIFPRIILPSIEKTSRMTVSYEMDTTQSWLTVYNTPHQYTFRRDVNSRPSGDNLLKIFLTQLFFDSIIKSLHL